MDHFQRSMSVKKRIEGDASIMKSLRGHFLESRRLEMIGAGTNHAHFRAGMLPDGLGVATRETFDQPVPSGASARDLLICGLRTTGMWNPRELELYAKEAHAWTETGRIAARSVREFVSGDEFLYVTSFCIGVRYRTPWMEKSMYALLVEDLTAGGAFRLESPQDKDWLGRIPGKEGAIQIDLDDMPRFIRMHKGIPDYLSEQALLVLE